MWKKVKSLSTLKDWDRVRYRNGSSYWCGYGDGFPRFVRKEADRIYAVFGDGTESTNDLSARGQVQVWVPDNPDSSNDVEETGTVNEQIKQLTAAEAKKISSEVLEKKNNEIFNTQLAFILGEIRKSAERGKTSVECSVPITVNEPIFSKLASLGYKLNNSAVSSDSDINYFTVSW